MQNYEIIYEDITEEPKYEEIVDKVFAKCFEEEQLQNTKLYITVTFTSPQNIQKINQEYRNIDKATDVLSFPMFERQEIEENIKGKSLQHEDILGDIVISIPKVEEQAKEYGHSFERELSYMLVHGFYHLMGYDHMEEEDKKEMRAKEEKILGTLNISR